MSKTAMGCALSARRIHEVACEMASNLGSREGKDERKGEFIGSRESQRERHEFVV